MSEQPPKKPRSRKKWIWTSIVLSFFLLQFLNFSGFCYSDLRWYSKRQLVDIYLFGREGLEMSEAAKIKKIAEEKGGIYPDCCRLNDTYWPDKGWSFWETVFGERDYGLETHFPSGHVNSANPYDYSENSWSACGEQTHGITGIERNKKQYLNSLQDIREYWSEQ